MSTYLKSTEIKKPKNSTYQHSTHIPNSNFASKNSKLSFSNAFTNNTKRNKQAQGNSMKKRISKNQMINHHEDKNAQNSKILDNQTNILNKEEIKENHDCNEKIDDIKGEEEHEIKNKLNKVESYQSLEFLLPKKINNIEKTSEKNDRNRRSMTQQEAYDYDGNTFCNNNNIGSSDKKKNNNKEISPKKSEIKKNLNMDDEEDSEDKDEDNNEEDKGKYEDEEYIEKLKKQEELILELLKYKNFQNFVKNIVKNNKLRGKNKK